MRILLALKLQLPRSFSYVLFTQVSTPKWLNAKKPVLLNSTQWVEKADVIHKCTEQSSAFLLSLTAITQFSLPSWTQCNEKLWSSLNQSWTFPPIKKKKKATSTYLHVWHYCPIKLYKRHMYTFSQCREAKHVHNTASATRCLHHIPVGAWGFLHGGETMWSALPAVPVLWRRLVWQNKFLGMSSHKDWALRWCYMQFYLVCKYLYYIKQL